METNELNTDRKYRMHPFFGFLLVLTNLFLLPQLKNSNNFWEDPVIPQELVLFILIPLFIANVAASVTMIKDYIDNLDNNHFLTKYVIIYLAFISFGCGFLVLESFI